MVSLFLVSSQPYASQLPTDTGRWRASRTGGLGRPPGRLDNNHPPTLSGVGRHTAAMRCRRTSYCLASQDLVPRTYCSPPLYRRMVRIRGRTTTESYRFAARAPPCGGELTRRSVPIRVHWRPERVTPDVAENLAIIGHRAVHYHRVMASRWPPAATSMRMENARMCFLGTLHRSSPSGSKHPLGPVSQSEHGCLSGMPVPAAPSHPRSS